MNASSTTLIYASFLKPSWAPPAWLFGPVWSVLYLIIILSFGYVFYQAWKGKVKRGLVLLLVVNLVSNLIFNPLLFFLRSTVLATLDIYIVLLSLIFIIMRTRTKYPWVAIVNIPYLLWVSFATVLQMAITYLNW